MTRRAVWIVVAVVLAALVAGGVWEWRALAPVGKSLAELYRQNELYGRPFEPYVKSLEDAGEVLDVEKLDGPMPPESENAAGEIDAAWKELLAAEGPIEQWPTKAVLGAPDPAARDALLADAAK